MNKFKKYLLYAFFDINLVAVLIFWWMGSGILLESGNLPFVLLALGRLTGVLAVYFVLLQFVLMGRAVWLEQLFGLDKLARVHRLNGYLSMLFIILHPALLTISYGVMGKLGYIAQLIKFLKNDDLLQAFISVIFFIAVVFLSIYIVRRHIKYESWYFVHLFTYLAVLLAWEHQLEMGGDFLSNPVFVYYWYLLYAFVFGNVLFYRFLKPILAYYKHQFFIQKVVQETPNAVSIFITGKDLAAFKADPGQFFIFRFLTKEFWWQAHPFSLSAVPNSNYLRITIKNCGDFTQKANQLKKGTKVFIEGPYGIFKGKKDSNIKYLFIAGGVGIAPIRAIIEKIAPTSNLVLLYNCKSESELIFKEELDLLSKQHHFSVHYIISNQPDYTGEKGRIDEEKISRLVHDLHQREVYFCGPEPMLDSILDTLKSLQFKSNKIHYEKFTL